MSSRYSLRVANPKILLFYVFTPLADPEAIRLWQKTVCEVNDLKGRIIVSPHGINVTVGGELDDVKRYLKATRAYVPFRWMDVKWANGTGDDFPRLSVKVRDEIVNLRIRNLCGDTIHPRLAIQRFAQRRSAQLPAVPRGEDGQPARIKMIESSS